MAIDKKEARKIAEDMIKATGENLSITCIDTVENDDGEIYMFWVKNNDSGDAYHPGEKIKCISGNDGTIVDFVLLPPID